MKAMVLAAGLGHAPAAAHGRSSQGAGGSCGPHAAGDHALAACATLAFSEVIVNAHHFADMVVDYLQAHDNFGMRIEISREDDLLDTGGGLKKAAVFFLERIRRRAFLLHNVDVISTIDLRRMVRFHKTNQALPRWRCRSVKLRVTCSSTNSFSSAGGRFSAINKSFVLPANPSRWPSPVSMSSRRVCCQ